MLAFNHLEPTDPAADDHTDAGGIGGVDAEAALLHRHRRRCDRELDEPGALLHFLLLDPPQRIEVRHFAGEPGRIPRGIEGADWGDP